MRTSRNDTPTICPIRRIHRELLRYHLCGCPFAAPRNSCLYVPQRPLWQHGKLLARRQNHSQRPQSLPQHGQAGTNRSGAAWLSCPGIVPMGATLLIFTHFYEKKWLVSKYDTNHFARIKCRMISFLQGETAHIC